tara:strand:+ start:3062 stop:3850 length:789 start_codon:yes stop_codon:yes gene_type:complete
MKIIGWNINGIRGKSMNLFNKDKTINNECEFSRMLELYNPEVVCFGETKCQEIHVENFEQLPFKYKSWNCSRARKGYSGVCILSNIEFTDLGSIPINDGDIEGRSRVVEFEECVLIYVYTPNSGGRGEYRIEWDTVMYNYLEELKEKNKMIILGGDMNVVNMEQDIHSRKVLYESKLPGTLLHERLNFRKYFDIGYIDIWRKKNEEKKQYTWWNPRVKGRDRNIGWRIDYYLINKEYYDNVKDVKILDDIKGSDHCPIYIEI